AKEHHAREKSARKAEPAAAEDLSLFEGPVRAETFDELPAYQDADDPVALSEDELPVLGGRRKDAPPAEVAGLVTKLGLQGGRVRPGEQEVFKSPIILGLTGGGIVLLLIAATIYLLMGRESAIRLFDVASTDLAEGRFVESIENYEKFVALYPRHTNAETAKVNIGRARVQRELAGGSPAWSNAWDSLNEFVREFRNTPGYQELRPIVLDFSERIAVGAAKTAETTRDRKLLPISREAAALLERTADQETPLDGILSKIRDATDKANAAIARQDARDAAVKVMQAAIAGGRAIDALSERDRLLRSYPMYATDKGVQTVLNEALAQAKSTVTSWEPGPAAQPAPEPAVMTSVLPAFHQRSRTDEASLGQTVWVLAQDSCYAVDTVTGEIVWRRAIGGDPAFPPGITRGSPAGWLLFDRRTGELVHCRSDNGQTLWRLALPAPPRGAPLVEQGQIYLATADRKLLRIDQETGALTSGLQFAQDVIGPPTVDAAGDHLFLTGSRGLIYALSMRPLECVAVTFTDHAEGAIAAPLVTLGQLLLVCQNDRPEQSRLRVFNASEPTKPLPAVDDQSIAGAVFDPPVLRGPQLVVPSQGERLTAFVVNDDPGRMGLTKVGDYRVQDAYGGPMRVLLGPDQQFWMSSTAFRRFKIEADSISMDPTPVAVGLTSQPLQVVAETFFVARRLPFGEAVQFTNVDRDRMSGTWRTAVGARPRLILGSDSGPVAIVTDSGFVYTVGANRLASGGTELRGGFSLELSPALAEPLLIGPLSDGRAVIAAGGEVLQCWIVEANGRVGTPFKLTKAVERPPVLLDAGLVLPLSGRLQVRPLTGNAKYEDWRAPADGNAPPVWEHVIRTSGDELLAADANGRWRRLQLRGGDVPHLAEVVHVDYAPPAKLSPVFVGESLLMADIQHTLRKLAVRTLDEQSKRDFPDGLRGIASVDDQSALVWDDRVLRMVDLEKDFADRWTVDLEGLSPVGSPVVRGSQAWLGCTNGTVLILDLTTCKVLSRLATPQALSLGVIAIQGAPWAVAVDGTLYRLSVTAEAQQ
ncbi:MAG TPA: PQQ-binding-like beta-propeller repeat protein, partial [Planctomycetaceae bacterium]|nr:PQQ-binding-like beta-propeller repeat protein [Planctomycetaceae bacterium]